MKIVEFVFEINWPLVPLARCLPDGRHRSIEATAQTDSFPIPICCSEIFCLFFLLRKEATSYSDKKGWEKCNIGYPTQWFMVSSFKYGLLTKTAKVSFFVQYTITLVCGRTCLGPILLYTKCWSNFNWAHLHPNAFWRYLFDNIKIDELKNWILPTTLSNEVPLYFSSGGWL